MCEHSGGSPVSDWEVDDASNMRQMQKFKKLKENKYIPVKKQWI